MPGSTAAEIDALDLAAFCVRRKEKRCGLSEGKGHAKCDECEVAVEHHRPIDASERSEFFGDALGFSQKRISKKAAECHVDAAHFSGRDRPRATQTARQ